MDPIGTMPLLLGLEPRVEIRNLKFDRDVRTRLESPGASLWHAEGRSVCERARISGPETTEAGR